MCLAHSFCFDQDDFISKLPFYTLNFIPKFVIPGTHFPNTDIRVDIPPDGFSKYNEKSSQKDFQCETHQPKNTRSTGDRKTSILAFSTVHLQERH